MNTDGHGFLGRGALRASGCAQRSPAEGRPHLDPESSCFPGEDLKTLTPALSHPMEEGERVYALGAHQAPIQSKTLAAIPSPVGRERVRVRVSFGLQIRVHPCASVVKNHGFTLIELMVVMVLIGILTAMIIPEMKGTFQDALLRSTGRELVNVFGIAYSLAVSLNQVHRVRLDSANGRYMIEKAVGTGRAALRAAGESGGDFIPIQDVPGSQGTLDVRISIQIRSVMEMPMNSSGEPARAEPMNGTDEPVDTISFYPDGTADGREIILRDRDGFGLALRISPITARVELSGLERE